MNNPDTQVKYNMMGLLGLGEYHFFPRWYTESSSHKVLDPYVFMGAGYATTDNSQSGLGLTTGVGASYGLTNGFKVYGEYEILMFKKTDNIYGSYSIGIGWEF
jgi:opacity protein-like surface antigen